MPVTMRFVVYTDRDEIVCAMDKFVAEIVPTTSRAVCGLEVRTPSPVAVMDAPTVFPEFGAVDPLNVPAVFKKKSIALPVVLLL